MEVEEPGEIHINTDPEEGLMRVFLSENWGEIYQRIKERLIDAGLISIEVDTLEGIADRFIGFLTLDLGPISVSLGLMAVALYEICEKLTVTGYNIARTPAVFGKATFGKSQFGRGGYTIEPATLE